MVSELLDQYDRNEKNKILQKNKIKYYRPKAFGTRTRYAAIIELKGMLILN